MGQILFYPPNVAGWPGDRTWIDSSTMMVRLQIPQVLAAKESITIKAKNDDDVNMGMEMEQQQRINKNKIYTNKGGSATIDWGSVVKIFEKTKREDLATSIANSVLQTQSRPGAAILGKYVAADSRDNFIKTSVIQLMTTPEYQLC